MWSLVGSRFHSFDRFADLFARSLPRARVDGLTTKSEVGGVVAERALTLARDLIQREKHVHKKKTTPNGVTFVD